MFQNIILGPLVGIDDLKRKKEHYDDILNRGYIPIALIDNEENPVFEGFKKNKEKMKIKAVFVTVQYKESYG